MNINMCTQVHKGWKDKTKLLAMLIWGVGIMGDFWLYTNIICIFLNEHTLFM